MTVVTCRLPVNAVYQHAVGRHASKGGGEGEQDIERDQAQGDGHQHAHSLRQARYDLASRCLEQPCNHDGDQRQADQACDDCAHHRQALAVDIAATLSESVARTSALQQEQGNR